MRMIFNCLVERSAVGLWWVRLIYVLTRTCLAVGANVSLYIVVTLLRLFSSFLRLFLRTFSCLRRYSIGHVLSDPMQSQYIICCSYWDVISCVQLSMPDSYLLHFNSST